MSEPRSIGTFICYCGKTSEIVVCVCGALKEKFNYCLDCGSEAWLDAKVKVTKVNVR